MVELIITIILIGSFLGVAVILFRKMPVLVKLPETSGAIREYLIARAKKGVESLPVLKDFSYELFLQKTLSKVRVLTLKTEHKTGNWLETLRQKNNQKANKNDNYWKELKKAKNGK